MCDPATFETRENQGGFRLAKRAVEDEIRWEGGGSKMQINSVEWDVIILEQPGCHLPAGMNSEMCERALFYELNWPVLGWALLNVL